MNILNYFKPSGKRKRFFLAWQIELTTRCPLQCLMCPRTVTDSWRGGDMDFGDFQKLLPYFHNVETVILEGWGESLLHPHLLDAIRLVKSEGARVGFVTSGKGLDDAYISQLVETGVDFIGFSIAGATGETHNAIRVHSDLTEIIHQIMTIQKAKQARNTSSPKLHLIYLMLKDNISEVPLLPELAEKLGIGEVVLTNLTHMVSSWQVEQGVFSCQVKEKTRTQDSDKLTTLVKLFHRTEKAAKKEGIAIKYPSLTPREVAVCEENPLRNLYIATDGEVTPCVYMNPPVASPFTRFFCGEKHQLEKLSFGNIFRAPFAKIWEGQEYGDFRERFERRAKVITDMQSRLHDMDALARFRFASLPDPPVCCRTCHKQLGF